MRYVLISSSVAALISFSCASQPAGSDTADAISADAVDVARKFEGGWKLASWTDKNEEGETIHPFGEDAFGRIVYGPAGTMAVVLSRRDRSVAGSEEGSLAGLSAEDLRLVASGFFAYSGGYTVDEEAGTVTHHIEACINPEWVGGDRSRRFELLTEDRIALRPVEGTSELIWEREK